MAQGASTAPCAASSPAVGGASTCMPLRAPGWHACPISTPPGRLHQDLCNRVHVWAIPVMARMRRSSGIFCCVRAVPTPGLFLGWHGSAVLACVYQSSNTKNLATTGSTAGSNMCALRCTWAGRRRACSAARRAGPNKHRRRGSAVGGGLMRRQCKRGASYGWNTDWGRECTEREGWERDCCVGVWGNTAEVGRVWLRSARRVSDEWKGVSV